MSQPGDSWRYIVEPEPLPSGSLCTANRDQICAAALAWVQDEIKTGPASLVDVGKFFFTVSTGSVAVVAAISKLVPNFQVGWVIGISMLLYLGSVVVAVIIVFPQVWKLSDTTDLLAVDRKKIARGRIWTIAWLAVWLAAVVLTLIALS